ncbi:putative AAA domain-containing protein YrvN [Pediococcus pentosaceus]|uniref:Putative AAA domain-containing protein YrvN n=1 Tax=Pediococcus pentosaceus TaxID=1255 RepID=A0A1Y0VPG2_PEDPE|nr:putative AAA domain-containing protein YrvN [Pediococcus pentosaceus]
MIELCVSPKSNSGITAIDNALTDVRTGKIGEVPDHLRDSHYKGAAALGRGVDYKYPHNYPNDWIAQQYLPDKLVDAAYFEAKGNSTYEEKIKNRYESLKKSQRSNH